MKSDIGTRRERAARYQEFLQSDFWLELTARVKAKAGKCAKCGGKKFLQSHHVTYPRDWYQTTEADLVVLCRTCHRKAHRKEKPKQRKARSAPQNGSEIRDTFQGDNKLLRECIRALIELNDSNSLVPHGIGGHARNLLSACYHRMSNRKRMSSQKKAR